MYPRIPRFRFSNALGLALLASAAAHSQTEPLRLNLQVSNIDRSNSCGTPYFRPQFKITNWGATPARLNQATVRLFFNALPQAPVEFVNADYAVVFNANGSITGGYATAYHFDAPPYTPACRESLYTGSLHVARQQHFIAFQGDVTIPANGGYATVIVQFRRAGGLNPFDVDCDDWTRLNGYNPWTPFEDGPYYSLVRATGGSPGAGYPTHLMCEYTWTAPTNGGRDLSDPWGGVDPCTLTQSQDCPVGPRR